MPPATIPGRLSVGPAGRVRGPAHLLYNDEGGVTASGLHLPGTGEFPCPNGSFGSGAMNGVVMHTMVCNLPQCVDLFNNREVQASAHFGIAQDGTIWQFGPIGKGWYSWAEVAGNLRWYSIEHADNRNPNNPLTAAQIAASAQLVELLARFAGFPLALTDSVTGRGFGVHSMGGPSWGGHTCPDLPPHHVRSEQRPVVLELARKIRAA